MRTATIAELEIPASTRQFPFADIGELLESIRETGITEPIQIVVTGSGRLIVSSGFRRLYCAIALGLKTVPVTIV